MMRGFTLTEVLIVVGIALVLFSAAIPMYGGFQVSAQLNDSSALFVQHMRMAKQHARARFHEQSHGIYVDVGQDTNRYVRYEGNSYASRNTAYDQVESFGGEMNLSTDIPGGDVHFSAGTGYPSATGTVTFSHAAGGSRVIEINSFGTIEMQ